MKLEMAVMAGPESKQFLVDFTKQLDRLEKLTKLGGTKTMATTDTTDEEEDEDFPTTKKTTKATSFDDEDEASFDAAEDDASKGKTAKATSSFEDEDEEEEEAPKKKKTAKVTADDVNDACKARIAYEVKKSKGKKTASQARKIVYEILDSEFGVESVTELAPTDYAAAVKAMTA